jgi:hypothetical protein
LSVLGLWGGVGVGGDRLDGGVDVNIDWDHWDLLDCLSLSILFLTVLFSKVSENIVEYKVTVGLFGKEEGLGEFSPRSAVVGHFTNHENDDTASGRSLRVDAVNVDFAVDIADGRDLGIDGLGISTYVRYDWL